MDFDDTAATAAPVEIPQPDTAQDAPQETSWAEPEQQTTMEELQGF